MGLTVFSGVQFLSASKIDGRVGGLGLVEYVICELRFSVAAVFGIVRLLLGSVWMKRHT
jgi:hypothetical protein